jgi:hypothetical protein
VHYALLTYAAADAWGALSDEERATWVTDEVAFEALLADAGAVVHRADLADAEIATSVRVRDGEPRFTDGPAGAGTEHLGGFLVIDVPDLDAALEVARRSPAARTGTVEIRPVANV